MSTLEIVRRRHGIHGGVTLLVAVVLAGGLACCAPRSSPVPSPASADGEAAEYVIGPGDKLGVFVYDQPQLSVPDIPVRPDGRISTPLVADVVAAGKTPAQLADELTERLKKYVKDPNVTVMVQSFVGPFDRQIRVIGQAVEPEALPYSANMTVLDVVIATKGLTRFAAGNNAVIIRRKLGGGQEKIPVRLSDLVKDGDISQNVAMQPGDTLLIPETFF